MGGLYIETLGYPKDANSPISAGVICFPFSKTKSPETSSSPLNIILLPFFTGDSIIIVSFSAFTFSISITVSALAGTGAPVIIFTASPGFNSFS